MLQLNWLWTYMGEKRRYFVVGLILSALGSGLLIVNPMLSKMLIDDVVMPKKTDLLLPILAAMMGVQLLRVVMRYAMVVLMEKCSQQTVHEIQMHLYNVILHQDYKFQGRMRTGNLMTRMTNDLEMMRHTLSWVSYNVVDSFVIYVSALTYLCFVNLPLTLALAAITPVILLITRMFSRKVRPLYIALRDKLSVMSTVAQENIEGNRVVKAFAKEAYEKEKFEKCNEDFRKTNLKAAYVGAAYQPILELLSQSLTVITLLMGGIFMINGKLSAGELLAFTSLTWALANPLRNLGMLISDLQRFFASCNKLIEVFYAQPTIVNLSTAKEHVRKEAGEVAFENVGFVVEDNEVLHDISFHLRPGQTMGILGSTGSGKTALVNLLMRFYEPSAGEVMLDGENVQAYTISSLRRSIGLAMQDVFLFSDTVSDNISYGRSQPQEEIVRCASCADADGFIRKMDGGYDTLIGERGVGLSGGQRQRVSLARALAVKPSVLVLDDTTSAVDMETEQYIQKQLQQLDFSCTKIIIAQRVSSISSADMIIVMDKGRIIERGTHEQLLENKGYYYRIWALQNDVSPESEVS